MEVFSQEKYGNTSDNTKNIITKIYNFCVKSYLKSKRFMETFLNHGYLN